MCVSNTFHYTFSALYTVYKYTVYCICTYLIYLPQVNLCTGVPVDGSPETCTAGAGTLSVEFTLLSRLVGDPTYENLARRAVRALWDKRHPATGLVGELRREKEGEGKRGRSKGLLCQRCQ